MDIGPILASIQFPTGRETEEAEERIYSALVAAVGPASQAAVEKDVARDKTRPVAEEDAAIDKVPISMCPWKEYKDSLTGVDLDKAGVETAMTE